MTFRESPDFKRGQRGERLVAEVLLAHGYSVVPTCLIENGGAPRLWTGTKSFVLPDFDVTTEHRRFWVEVKTFLRSPWNHTYRCNVHGIERRLVDDYLEVAARTHADLRVVVCETMRDNAHGSSEPTGVLLGVDLTRIEILPCLGKHGHSGDCLAYWRRNDMTVIWSFDPACLEDSDRLGNVA